MELIFFHRAKDAILICTYHREQHMLHIILFTSLFDVVTDTDICLNEKQLSESL